MATKILSKQELLEQHPRLCECCLAVNCGCKRSSKRSTPEKIGKDKSKTLKACLKVRNPRLVASPSPTRVVKPHFESPVAMVVGTKASMLVAQTPAIPRFRGFTKFLPFGKAKSKEDVLQAKYREVVCLSFLLKGAIGSVVEDNKTLGSALHKCRCLHEEMVESEIRRRFRAS